MCVRKHTYNNSVRFSTIKYGGVYKLKENFKYFKSKSRCFEEDSYALRGVTLYLTQTAKSRLIDHFRFACKLFEISKNNE